MLCLEQCSSVFSFPPPRRGWIEPPPIHRLNWVSMDRFSVLMDWKWLCQHGGKSVVVNVGREGKNEIEVTCCCGVCPISQSRKRQQPFNWIQSSLAVSPFVACENGHYAAIFIGKTRVSQWKTRWRFCRPGLPRLINVANQTRIPPISKQHKVLADPIVMTMVTSFDKYWLVLQVFLVLGMTMIIWIVVLLSLLLYCY